MRGCGAGEDLARGTTHCGRWADAAAAIEFVAQAAPASPTALVGFSLGGTIALNFAGRIGGGVVRQSGRRDGGLCADRSALREAEVRYAGRPAVRSVLRRLVVEKVVAADARAGRIVGGRLVASARGGCGSSMRSITAPLAGFASVDDYYTRTSPGPRLSAIRVPTTILAAADDPVVPTGPLERARRGTAVEVFVTQHGGHLGYVGRRNGDPDRRWLDWRVVEWVTAVCGTVRSARC